MKRITEFHLVLQRNPTLQNQNTLTQMEILKITSDKRSLSLSNPITHGSIIAMPSLQASFSEIPDRKAV